MGPSQLPPPPIVGWPSVIGLMIEEDSVLLLRGPCDLEVHEVVTKVEKRIRDRRVDLGYHNVDAKYKGCFHVPLLAPIRLSQWCSPVMEKIKGMSWWEKVI